MAEFIALFGMLILCLYLLKYGHILVALGLIVAGVIYLAGVYSGTYSNLPLVVVAGFSLIVLGPLAVVVPVGFLFRAIKRRRV